MPESQPESLRVASRFGQPVLPLIDRAHDVTCGGPMPKLVFLVMVCLARRTGTCWAAVPTIARHAEAGVTTVRRALRTLALGGRIEPEGGVSRGRRTTHYRLVDVGPGRSGRVEPGRSDRVEPGRSDRVEPGRSDRVGTRDTRPERPGSTSYDVTAARDVVREAAQRAELAKPRVAGSNVGASRPVSNGRAGRALRSGIVPSAEATARMLAANRAERRRLSQLRHEEPEG